MKKKHPQIVRIFFCFSSLLLLLVGCATYNSQTQIFQTKIQQGDTKSALEAIDNNKFLSKPRNLLLYLLEKGKVAYLDGNHQLSNDLFNQADTFIENNKKEIGNQIIGVLLNPEKETYKGEDFEKVAIHYYKALNYTFLNKYDDALVEAKRITLQLQKLNESYPEGKKNRYKEDAFALNLQGLLYEASGDINNAFIAYRNAVDVYLENQGTYIGVSTPNQLKQDLFRTADSMGFTNDLEVYQKKLNTKYVQVKNQPQKEVVVFWENGLIPYKDETFFTFTIIPNTGLGYATIVNKDLAIDLPIPTFKNNSSLEIFNVAFPRYISRQVYYNKATVTKDSISYNFQLAQDYDEIAFKTLDDRKLREIGKTAIRIATKKATEYTVKNQNEGLGTVLGIINAFTESADTRNWQSLPSKIYYSRIPLKTEDTHINVQLESNNGVQDPIKIDINTKKGLQFKKVSSYRVQK